MPSNFRELFVNHKNSDVAYNYLWNLEWVTPKENTLHGIQYGYRTNMDISGEKNPMAVLTEAQVYEIYNLLVEGVLSNYDIAKLYNISSSVIDSISKGYSWKHLNLDISKIRVSKAFTNEEINKICEYFSTHEINNKSIYKNPVDIIRECFFELKLYEKYDFNKKNHTLKRLLYKSRESLNIIANNYNYEYIR